MCGMLGITGGGKLNYKCVYLSGTEHGPWFEHDTISWEIGKEK